VRSLDRPVAAKYAPTVAFSPDVEKCGLVLPRRNCPHSGWPTEPQPFGSLVRPRTSDQPIGLFGQPSASAIGLGMARTSGDCATVGIFPSGTTLPLSVAVLFCFNRVTQDAAAGVQTCGAGPPSRLASQPAASASIAAPEAFEVTVTSAHLPLNLRSLAPYAFARSRSSAAFSLDATTDSCTQPARLACCCGWSPPAFRPARSTRYVPQIATRPTTTAMTSGNGLRRRREVSNVTSVRLRGASRCTAGWVVRHPVCQVEATVPARLSRR
jgi:hypothetical protein